MNEGFFSMCPRAVWGYSFTKAKGHPEHSRIFFVTESVLTPGAFLFFTWTFCPSFYSSKVHPAVLPAALWSSRGSSLTVIITKTGESTHPHITEQSLEIWDFKSSSRFPLWGHLLVLLWITSRVSVFPELSLGLIPCLPLCTLCDTHSSSLKQRSSNFGTEDTVNT